MKIRIRVESVQQLKAKRVRNNKKRVNKEKAAGWGRGGGNLHVGPLL
jgi:hypothetical protein